MKFTSILKLIPDNDIKTFVNIARNAYPRMKANTPEEIEKNIENLTKLQNESPTKNLYGLYRNDEMLGGMLLLDFVMNFATKKIKAGGVGFVGVEFLHKKEKVAKELITYYLDHYLERGIYMATLYPFRPDFYKQMGFGFGTKMNQYRIKPNLLPKGDSKKNVVFASEDDKQQIIDCYNRFVDKTHGMIEKADKDMDMVFKNPENRIVVHKKNDKITGYIVFSFVKYEHENFLTNDININEFIYESKETFSDLITFLHSQDDQIRHIILNTQEEGFHHIMNNPSNGSNNIIPHVYHESNTQGVGIMYRVIDIKGMFNELKNHNYNNQTCKLKLSIKDSFMEANDRSFYIDFNNGLAEIVEADNYEVQISMDISDFSSMLMGSVNFKSLNKYGLAEISHEDYIEKINKIFYMDEKPMCTTPF